MPDVRWAGVPAAVRAMVLAAAAVFAYGTVVHVLHIVERGWDAYPTLPGWLATYSLALTLLDPLAAVLLLLRRRAGLVLGCAVLVTDAVATGLVTYGFDTSGGTLARIGQAVVTLLAVALLVAARWIRPWLDPL